MEADRRCITCPAKLLEVLAGDFCKRCSKADAGHYEHQSFVSEESSPTPGVLTGKHTAAQRNSQALLWSALSPFDSMKETYVAEEYKCWFP